MKINFFFTETYDFLFGFDDVSVKKIIRSLSLLEQYGNTIRYPHTKYISDGVFELRIIGANNIRIFFVFKNEEAIILHAVVKKTQKLSQKDIKYVIGLRNRLR